jgi:hypothetical protein
MPSQIADFYMKIIGLRRPRGGLRIRLIVGFWQQRAAIQTDAAARALLKARSKIRFAYAASLLSRRRPRSTARPPNSSVRALVTDAGSISGAAVMDLML